MSGTPLDRLNAALFGRYEIQRELGEGGMATVYLARDLKHNRSVALKVLKPELAAVVGAERFLAEIETTANLQHPNILPLFDSGEADGFLFYVMPYVEGDSLRDRLDRERQLPVDEAIRITTAVANALQHAHDRGVVHRDIKPANILVQDGQPVVGDFGIALAVGAAGGARLTETGLSVGTPYYMSPEQATGDQVLGPASDTYALAAVLYEMLTGDPPYVGSTAQAVLGKIIQGSPTPATEIRKSIPPNVDAAIRKALEKLPADRFTRVQDFARALSDPGFRYGGEVSRAVDPGRWKLATVALATTTVAFAALAGWALGRPEPERGVTRLPLATVEGHMPSEWLSLTPDGRGAVVSQAMEDGSLQPFYWRWEDLSRTMLPGVETRATDPFISPSGDEVAYFDAGGLRAVPLAGGIVRTLSEDANCCGRWGDDGYIYFSPTARNIVRVPQEGGAGEEVTPVAAGESHGYFQILPDGDVGVFTVWGNPNRLEAIRLSTGERATLTTGVRSYVTPTGHLVFGSLDGQILAARFDADALEIVGSPVPVVQGVGTSASSEVFYTLSDNGTLLYWQGAEVSAEEQFLWITRAGEVTPVDPTSRLDAGGNNQGWSLSPDGTRVAYRELGEGDGGEIWIKRLDRGPLACLTFDPGSDWSPVWSAGGDTVFFASDRGGGDGGRDVWARRADGIGEPTLVLATERSITDFARSPDGAWIVYRVGGAPSRDIFAQRPGTDDEPIAVAASPAFDEVSPALSPDGRWIAYVSDETGESQVYVRPFPDVDGGRWQVSSGLAIAPRWSADGSEIFFASPAGMFAATVAADAGFAVQRTERLFEWPGQLRLAVSVLTNQWYDVTPDGERFLIAGAGGVDETGNGVEPRLILVQNFFEELERRLPPR